MEAGQSGGLFSRRRRSPSCSRCRYRQPQAGRAHHSVLRFSPLRLHAGRADADSAPPRARATYAALCARAGATKRPGPSSIRLAGFRDLARDSSWPGCSGRSTTGWTAWPCARACGTARAAGPGSCAPVRAGAELEAWAGAACAASLSGCAPCVSAGRSPPSRRGRRRSRAHNEHTPPKGLEFPVVFIGDTARQVQQRGPARQCARPSDLGLGPKYTDAARGIEYPTLACRAVARRLEREQLSEELRLLYSRDDPRAGAAFSPAPFRTRRRK